MEGHARNETEASGLGLSSLMAFSTGMVLGTLAGLGLHERFLVHNDSWLPLRYNKDLKLYHQRQGQCDQQHKPGSRDDTTEKGPSENASLGNTPIEDPCMEDMSCVEPLSDVVARVLPSVAHLEVRLRLDPRGHAGEPGQEVLVSSGTAFAIRSDGIMLTTAHTLLDYLDNVDNETDADTETGSKDAANCTAVFADGKRFDCRVLAADLDADLAILQLQPHTLSLKEDLGGLEAFNERQEGLKRHKEGLEKGNGGSESENGFPPALDVAPMWDMAVGDAVFTIGSPLGFGHSVTRGTLSYKHRSVATSASLPENEGRAKGLLGRRGDARFHEELLYSQLAFAGLAGGSSGGPVFNARGQVIAMVAFKAVAVEPPHGIPATAVASGDLAFAVELDAADVRLAGLFRRPHLSSRLAKRHANFGLHFVHLKQSILAQIRAATAKSDGLENQQFWGLLEDAFLVTRLDVASPLVGRLMVGDIVTRINGVHVAQLTSQQILDALAKDVCRVSVIRLVEATSFSSSSSSSPSSMPFKSSSAASWEQRLDVRGKIIDHLEIELCANKSFQSSM